MSIKRIRTRKSLRGAILLAEKIAMHELIEMGLQVNSGIIQDGAAYFVTQISHSHIYVIDADHDAIGQSAAPLRAGDLLQAIHKNKARMIHPPSGNCPGLTISPNDMV